MMLAQGEDVNTRYHYELIMVFVKYSIIQGFGQILFIAFREEEQRFCVAIWGS